MLKYVRKDFGHSMAKSRYINLYLPEELVDKIDSIAAKEDRSRNYVIRKMLEESVEKIQTQKK